MRDKSLSTYVHKVRVIVKDGSLTLRGPVRGGAEKAKVADLARQTAGTEKVNDLCRHSFRRGFGVRQRHFTLNLAY